MPGLVVMGGDLCPTGREFQSQQQLLAGSLTTFMRSKLVLLFESTKNNSKEACDGPFRIINENNLAHKKTKREEN